MNMPRLLLLLIATTILNPSVAAQVPSPTHLDANAEKRRADALEQRLFNYANYARYAESNAKLGPRAKGEDRVVFIGDSITDGWNLTEMFPGKPYVNRGISGQTTSQMLIRFRPDVIALRPRIAVILAGTNDIAGNTGPITTEAIVDNLTSMVDLAHANRIAVVLSSVMPVSDYNTNQQGNRIIQTVRRPPAKIRELNERIKKLCSERKLLYLDYYTPMVDANGFLREELSYDGLHASLKGYEVMKATAEPVISAALKQTRKE